MVRFTGELTRSRQRVFSLAVLATWAGFSGCSGVGEVGSLQSHFGGIGPLPGSGSKLFLDGFFPIGVDGPVETDFALWADRGMNTIVRGPPGPGPSTFRIYENNINAWNSAHPSQAFRRIREPFPGWGKQGADTNGYESADVYASDPDADASIPYDALLAWALPDEPDIGGSLSQKLTWVQQYSAKWTWADTNRPIFVNFGGHDLLMSNQPYAEAFEYADWICNDVYPYTGLGWYPPHVGDPSLVGQILDKISSMTDKPKISWIECGNVNSNEYSSGPTGPQIRTMIWNAIIHGARGYICWMGDADNNFSNSTTEAEGIEIGANNAWITSLAEVLQDEIIDPIVTGPNDSWGHGIIHIGGRSTPSGNFYFLQNVSDSVTFNGNVTLPGAGSVSNTIIYSPGSGWPISSQIDTIDCTDCITDGSISVNLGPNAVRIYQVY